MVAFADHRPHAVSAALMPLAALLVLYNFGFAIAVVPVLDQPKPLLWVLVSAYLGATALFFAAMLGRNTESAAQAPAQRLCDCGHPSRRWPASSAISVSCPAPTCSCCTTARAGPSTIRTCSAPSWCCRRSLALSARARRPPAQACVPGVLLLILLAGLFLSFSRGAWAQFASRRRSLMALEFVTTRSTRERARIVLLAILGLMAVGGFIAALLSIDQVAEPVPASAPASSRATTSATPAASAATCSASLLALDTPLGIGPLQFQPDLSRGPAQLLSQCLHVGRLARAASAI